MSSDQRQTEWRVSVLVTEAEQKQEKEEEQFKFRHSYLIRNLHPATVYQVEVRARNSYGWSPVSRLHTFFTPSVSSASSVVVPELVDGLLGMLMLVTWTVTANLLTLFSPFLK